MKIAEVKISPSGKHWHLSDCWMVQGRDYMSVDLKNALVGAYGDYLMCPACAKRITEININYREDKK